MKIKPTPEERERCLARLQANYVIATHRERSHAFVEAFALMRYTAQDGSNKGLSIWNSRNGVTPFCTFIDGAEYQHSHMELDQCIPTYLPEDGDYMFVDFTPELALAHMIARVEREWDTGAYPKLCKRWSVRWSAVLDLVRDTYESSVPPHLFQVTPEWAVAKGWTALRLQAAERAAIDSRTTSPFPPSSRSA